MVNKPTVGADVGTWGQELNDGLDELQADIDSIDTRLIGLPDATQIPTVDDLNAVAAVFAGGTPFDPTETVTTGDVRIYRGGLWEALEDLPANLPPLGVGDGSVGDQQLLLSRRSGFASWVTGGFGQTVYTVTNANDTGSGSLRAQVALAQAGGGGWIIFDPTFNSGVYDITLGSHFQIAGTGAQNITIDGRGCTVTIDNGGTPGALENGGTTGYTFSVGGRAWADYSAGGNTTPASNIIICNVNFESDFGGDNLGSDGGDSEDVFTVRHWARGLWVDHCTFTNPDQYHDGLFDVGYGATEITVSWCYFHTHHKALLIFDNSPHDQGGSSTYLPAGITEGSPGPYEIFVDGSGNPKTVTKVTHHHNYKSHLGERCPFAKADAVRVHCFNEWIEAWGAYNDAAGTYGTAGTVYYYPNFPGSETANTGAGYRIARNGQMLAENNVFTPYAGATGPALTKAINNTDGTDEGYLLTSGNVYEDGSSASLDVNPELVFDPLDSYTYTLDSTAGLKARLALAAGAGTALWEYQGVAPVVTTVGVQTDAVDDGPADTLNFAGTGLTTDYNPTTRVMSVTVDAGTADPTTFLDYVTSLPTPDAGHDHEYAFDETAGQLYQCIFVSGPNTWQWLPIAAPLTPTVVAGQELAQASFWPVAQATTATTTSTTMVDVTAAAITASWSGIVANSFDCTFTVPPSEAVIVRISALVSMATSAPIFSYGLWDVDAAAAITNSKAQVTNSASINRYTYEKRLGSAELTAVGTSFTVRPQFCASAGTASILAGGGKGPFRIQVFAAL